MTLKYPSDRDEIDQRLEYTSGNNETAINKKTVRTVAEKPVVRRAPFVLRPPLQRGSGPRSKPSRRELFPSRDARQTRAAPLNHSPPTHDSNSTARRRSTADAQRRFLHRRSRLTGSRAQGRPSHSLQHRSLPVVRQALGPRGRRTRRTPLHGHGRADFRRGGARRLGAQALVAAHGRRP